MHLSRTMGFLNNLGGSDLLIFSEGDDKNRQRTVVCHESGSHGHVCVGRLDMLRSIFRSQGERQLR